MKLTLISPYPDITAFGIRSLSAYLREQGHQTQLIFLPDPHGDNLAGLTARYDPAVLDQVVDLCRQSDIIGISLMTNFFDGAVEITKVLRRHLAQPILWGGIHPTIRPEECLEHADWVCIGEAEDALTLLLGRMAQGADYLSTPNFWFRHQGSIIKNPLSPLPDRLDRFPPPDYSGEDHHLMYRGKVVALTHTHLQEFMQRGTVSLSLGLIGYQTMTSRGCPYNCTYCINHTIMEMYGSKGKLRWRSVDHVITELMWVKKNLPFVNYIWISDDEFMARKATDIDYFCKRYREEIGLPFSCLISALSVSDEKMARLVDAGLIYVQMGVESGSARMQAHFRRSHINNDKMMKAIRIINAYKDRISPPSYDFLLDVPGETDEDRIASLRFIADIPKPFHLQPFKLILYPGTHLYNLAKAEGLIKDERMEIYNSTYTMHSRTYLNLLFTLAKGGRLPAPVLRGLISAPVLFVCNSKLARPLIAVGFSVLRSLYQGLKKLRR